MPNKTPIGWTDFSSSPLRYRDSAGRPVWACVHASGGCVNCYAEALALRFGRGAAFVQQNIGAVTPELDIAELRRLVSSKVLAGKRVFVEDMSDLFGDWVPMPLIFCVWEVFAGRPDVTWQVLTKRPKRMRELLDGFSRHFLPSWPLPNVWLGVSVEDQPNDWRLDELLRCEAALHFVSYEPALGPLRLGDRLLPRFADDDPRHLLPDHCQLDWVICGAESGPKRRPFDPDWARRVRDQCQAVGVPFYFTQGSALAPGQRRELDGRTWDEYPQFANLGAWGASPG